MDAVMKVTFPTFSRLQNHPDLLKNSIKRSTFFVALLVFPSLAGIALIAPDFINLIPKYGKWAPAITPLYFYAAAAALAAVTTPLTNAFNAVGKITLTTKFMIMWTVLTWIFFPYLSRHYGYLGTSWAGLIVGLSSILVWFSAQKIFSVNIFKTISLPFVSSLLMIVSLLAFGCLSLSPVSLFTGKIIIGLTVYSLFHYLFSRDQLLWFINQIKNIRQ